MEVNEFNNISLYEMVAEFTYIGNKAVKAAREENFRLGLPNVIGKDGKVFHEFADGRIVQVFPEPNSI